MILVTGANGYVGGYVLKALAKSKAPADVRALVRSQAQLARLQAMGVQPVLGDVTEPQSLATAFQGVSQIIHLAAVNRDKGAVTMERVNQQGTINVVDAAKQAGVQHVVMVVGLGASPTKPYPLAKSQGVGVDYLVKSGLPYTILEASVVFGAGDEFLNTLAGLARIPPFMVVPGDGKSRFQPIAAQDVAACAVKSLELAEVKNRRLQICGSEVLSLEQIIDAILENMNLSRIKIHMPVPILKIAVNLMDKLLPKPPVTPSLLAQLGVDNVATDNATEKVFGVSPLKLRENIAFVREMTLSKLIGRTLGKADYR